MEPGRDGAGRPEAILRPVEAARAITVERRTPHPALTGLVDYLWTVHWDLGDHVHEQQVVPQPRVHLAAENGQLLVHGPGGAGTFDRRLTGRGRVVGAAFHPAGFRPFLSGSVHALHARVVPAQDLLAGDLVPVVTALGPGDGPDVAFDALEAFLLALDARPGPMTRTVSAWVAAAADPSVGRADQLAAQAGVSLRTVQRTFADHVGVGPQWVVQRERVLEIARRAHEGTPVDWSGLAARLGFSDQAHLVRAWTSLVGTPPAAYLRQAHLGR